MTELDPSIWTSVGGDDAGDYLLLEIPPDETGRREDTAIAWYAHEGPILTHTWPSIFVFLQSMVHVQQHGTPISLGSRWVSEKNTDLFALARTRAVDKSARVSTPHNDFVKCPHCGLKFWIKNTSLWNGSIHVRCGGLIELQPSVQ